LSGLWALWLCGCCPLTASPLSTALRSEFRLNNRERAHKRDKANDET